MKGGGLVVDELKQFLNNSYAEILANNIGDSQLDIELSNKLPMD